MKHVCAYCSREITGDHVAYSRIGKTLGILPAKKGFRFHNDEELVKWLPVHGNNRRRRKNEE